MRKLLLTSISVLALTAANPAQAGNHFNYPGGMNGNTVITSLSQVQELQQAVVAQGKADGVLTGSYYQNNPNGPEVVVAPGLGMDNMVFNNNGNNAVNIDPSVFHNNTLTASEVASELSHEDIHPMQTTLTNDNLSSDERANLNEAQADQETANIMGDNGQGLIGLFSQMVTDSMHANPGLDLTDANAGLSDPIHGDLWQRANNLCDTCSIPNTLVHNTDYDIGADKTLEDGNEITIPAGDDTVDGQLPDSLTFLNDQYAAGDEGFWDDDSLWDGGGGWGGGFGCDKINGGPANGNGIRQDNLVTGGC